MSRMDMFPNPKDDSHEERIVRRGSSTSRIIDTRTGETIREEKLNVSKG